MSSFLPFEQPCGCLEVRNDLLSCRVFGMRTRTCQRVASTSGGGYLAGLPRLAKSKIQTSLTQHLSTKPGRKRPFFRPSRRRAAACPRRKPSDWRSRSPASPGAIPGYGRRYAGSARRSAARSARRARAVPWRRRRGRRRRWSCSVSACDQRLLVDHRAAGDVDDIAVLAEPPQDIGIDDVMGVAAGAHRDHQHAAPFRERLETREILIRHVVLCCG